MTRTFDSDLEAAFRQLADELGTGWECCRGRGTAYGNDQMSFMQVKNLELAIAVRVWWRGSEVRISAVLGVPYETGDEILTRSVSRIVRVVAALCRGEYTRSNGVTTVRGWGRAAKLSEWAQFPVTLADPWGDGR